MAERRCEIEEWGGGPRKRSGMTERPPRTPSPPPFLPSRHPVKNYEKVARICLLLLYTLSLLPFPTFSLPVFFFSATSRKF